MRPSISSKVVLSRLSGVVGYSVYEPDMQPMVFALKGGDVGIPFPEDVEYVGNDTHGTADRDCMNHNMDTCLGEYDCTPCAINEGVAIGIEYPAAVRAQAVTLSFHRAKNSVRVVREARMTAGA